MNKYIAVTIGPIFDTINLTSSPASLWVASYMFSMTSKTICEELTQAGVKEENIISPYYKKDDELLSKKDGVGLFHDRIVFKSENFEIEDFEQIRANVIKKIAALFSLPEEYLTEYLMISAVSFEAENPVSESSPMLDSMELQKGYVFKESQNPILSLFTNDNPAGKEKEPKAKAGKNEAVKKLVKGLEDFQLRKNSESLKSLYDIACTGKGLKKYKYYAMVRSDGDNLNKIISSLCGDEKIREFSKNCLSYCYEISQIVKSFDGATIYSGGDDLLAILPCESRNGETIFEFIAAANALFNEHFGIYNKPISLSFGITIAYYKFPLYEALESSAHMLFDVAKSKKNGVVINLQKHSGQSANVFIANNALEEVIALKNLIFQKLSGNSEVLLSANYKLIQFAHFFENAKDDAQIDNIFRNIFDSNEHKGNTFVQEMLPAFFKKLKSGLDVEDVLDNEKISNKISAMFSLFRLLKFFVEKEGEED